MFLQQLINGLTIGTMYSLVAIGFSMVYGVLRMINFAHGELFMMGAFFGLIIYRTGIGIVPTFIIAACLTSILGMLVERFAYRPIRRSEKSSALIGAVGVSIMLSHLAQIIFGAEVQPFKFPVTVKTIGTITITDVQVYMLAITGVLMIGLFLFIKLTNVGIAMRATSHNAKNALLMGINTNRIIAFTFAIGSLLACIGGILIGIYYDAVWPEMGLVYGIKAFAAAILGGIGNLMGAAVCGIIIGVFEILGTAYISSGFRNGYAYGIMILVLILKPAGLFGTDAREKV
jgi:branched-chain amino acid transport system permease protein